VTKHVSWLVGLMVLALSMLAAPVRAQEHAPAPGQSDQLPATDADPHAPPLQGDRPVVPTDAAAWAGTMLIIIVAMFLMAAVIGPMVRMEIPVESDEDAHGDHGDAHGHGHGHGHGH